MRSPTVSPSCPLPQSATLPPWDRQSPMERDSRPLRIPADHRSARHRGVGGARLRPGHDTRHPDAGVGTDRTSDARHRASARRPGGWADRERSGGGPLPLRGGTADAVADSALDPARPVSATSELLGGPGMPALARVPKRATGGTQCRDRAAFARVVSLADRHAQSLCVSLRILRGSGGAGNRCWQSLAGHDACTGSGSRLPPFRSPLPLGGVRRRVLAQARISPSGGPALPPPRRSSLALQCGNGPGVGRGCSTTPSSATMDTASSRRSMPTPVHCSVRIRPRSTEEFATTFETRLVPLRLRSGNRLAG